MQKPFSALRDQFGLLWPAVRIRVFDEVRLWANPASNPFLLRELRRAARRGETLRLFIYTLLTIFGFNLAGWAVWLTIRNSDQKIHGLYPSYFDLPPYLGSNPIGFSALLTLLAGLCITPWVSFSQNLLQAEVLRGDIDQLRLIPQPEERWLWMTRAYPCLRSFMVWCFCLPLFTMAVFLDQWSLLDAFGTLILFLSISLTVPVYSPENWRLQADRKKGGLLSERKKNQNQPAISQQGEELGATNFGKIGIKASQTSGAIEEVNKPSQLSTLKATGLSIRVLNAAIIVWAAGCVGAQAYGSAVRWVPGSGLVGAALHRVQQDLPNTVNALWPGVPLTLPYIAAHLLFTPLPFFAFSLMPLLLWLPYTIALRRFQMADTAIGINQMQSGPSTARQPQKTAALRVIITLFCIAAAGYAWKLLIVNHAITSLMDGALSDLDWSLATAWTLALCMSSLMVRNTASEVFTNDKNGTATETWRIAMKSAGRSFAMPIAAYFVFCWLGGLSGYSAAWAARLPLTIFTALAFSLQAFGGKALTNALSKQLRPPWLLILWYWSYAPLVFVGLAAIHSLNMGSSSFSLSEYSYLLISPYTSLALLFTAPVPLVETSYGAVWWGPILQLSFGLASILIAYRLSFQATATGTQRTGFSAVSSMLLAPLRLVLKALKLLGISILQLLATLDNWLGHYDKAIEAYADRKDNPFLSEQIRKRTHTPAGATQVSWGSAWAIALAVEGCFIIPCLIGVMTTAGFTAKRLDYLALGILALLFFILAIGGLCFSALFKKDQISGNLVFVLLTPLTSQEILFGKVALGAVEFLVFALTLVPWLLLCSFIGSLYGNFATTAIVLCGLPAGVSMSLLVGAAFIGQAARLPDTNLAESPNDGHEMGYKRESAKGLRGSVVPAFGVILFFISMIFVCLIQQQGTHVLCALFLIACPCHLLLAKPYWQAAVDNLEERRTGDVALIGKVFHT